MKISPSFALAYDQICPILERLEAYVQPRLDDIARRHSASYFARIKNPESIIIKAEKEGYNQPFLEMHDLFACTITVPSLLGIESVLQEVESTFLVTNQQQRKLKPIEFDYNDLNLSLKIKPESLNKNEAYLAITFELQIKTLLQQAWAQAGHDVIYKAKKRTWGVIRISSQLRALLEMADSLLAHLEVVADTLQETRDYAEYSSKNDVVTILTTYWDNENLPQNLYRAAQVVIEYLRLANIDNAQLDNLLQDAKYTPYIKAKSLAPTQAIFIILFEDRMGDILPRLRNRSVILTDEMVDLCPKLNKILPVNRANLSLDKA